MTPIWSCARLRRFDLAAANARASGENPPVVNTADAIRDVGSAVDFILKRRSVPKVDLLRLVLGNHHHGRLCRRHCSQSKRNSSSTRRPGFTRRL